MRRYLGWALAAGLAVIGHASTASAQTHVDIGVFSPRVGARVVVGAPARVYAPPPVYAVRPGYRYERGRWVWVPSPRRYVYDRYYDPYYAHDGYRRDRARAAREYYRDVRKAQRDYAKDIRRAEREYRRDSHGRRW